MLSEQVHLLHTILDKWPVCGGGGGGGNLYSSTYSVCMYGRVCVYVLPAYNVSSLLVPMTSCSAQE